MGTGKQAVNQENRYGVVKSETGGMQGLGHTDHAGVCRKDGNQQPAQGGQTGGKQQQLARTETRL